jgi:diaminopimelate decarboxylase
VSLVELAERYGTPAYVYDLEAVRRAHADLRLALPDTAVLYYSLKANPHPDVVAQLVELGCRAEVSSPGEVRAALEAGANPGDLLLTGPGKTEQLIARALDEGVTRFSVESPRDLERVDSLAAEGDIAVDCLLRINADEAAGGVGLAMTGVSSQFGSDASWVAREPGRFRGEGAAQVTGLHLYMGTNLVDEDVLARQFEIGVRLAERLSSLLGGVSEVDLGGGFGAPFGRAGPRPRFPTLAGRVEELLDGRLPGWRRATPQVAFESGRYLVAESGTLVCRVVDVKESKGEVFVVLDAGINHLGGMAGLRRIPRILPELTRLDGDAERQESVLVGPLCTPLDVFGRGTELPRLEVGEVVAIPNVGAYGLTASLLAFLSFDPPAEVVVNGEEVISASRLDVRRSPVAVREPIRA